MMPVGHSALVLDANILIRAVLGSRVRDLILAHAHEFRFFVPDACVQDARKYLPEILAGRHIDPIPAMALLDALLRRVQILEAEWLRDMESRARERMRCRDEADWPVLAAALVLDCPVWTQDADLFGVGVATWSTEQIEHFFNQSV